MSKSESGNESPYVCFVSAVCESCRYMSDVEPLRGRTRILSAFIVLTGLSSLPTK
jgi:hypothetical protein